MDETSTGLLERFLDDSLSEADASQMLRKLDSDPAFRGEFSAALRMQGLLHARLDRDSSCERLAEVVTIAIKSGERSFDSRVMQEIRARGLTNGARPRRRLFSYAAAAALLLAAVFGGIVMTRGSRDRVLLAAGPATVVERGGSAVDVKPGLVLEPGDLLRTPRKGWASVRYADGTLVEIGADTRAVFEAGPSKRILVETGL